VIRLKQYPHTVIENARVGLAGPWWGLGAAIAAFAVHLVTGWQSWAAIARVGAWINLLNLVPIWQLDGGRGFAALTRSHRWIVVLVATVAWFLSGEGMLILLLIAAVVQTLGGKAPTDEAPRTLVEYVLLLCVLSWMTTISASVE